MVGPKRLLWLLSGNLPAMFRTADLQTFCGYFLAICQLCFYFAVNFVATIWPHNHVRSSFCSFVHAISNELRTWPYFLFSMDHYPLLIASRGAGLETRGEGLWRMRFPKKLLPIILFPCFILYGKSLTAGWVTDCSSWFTHRPWAFNLPNFLYNR